MPLAWKSLAVDCRDARALSAFWGAVLLAEPCDDGTPEEPEWVVDPDGWTTCLLFLQVPEAKTTKNRLHLDLTPAAGERDTEVERVLGLGATRVDIGQTGDESWVVLADPEGNEFCILSGAQQT